MVPAGLWQLAINSEFSEAQSPILSWLDQGGDVNDEDEHGGTLLSRVCQGMETAACLGRLAEIGAGRELARVLLDRGARLDGGTKLHRLTKFHYACGCGDAELVRLLLRAGADPNVFYVQADEDYDTDYDADYLREPPLFYLLSRNYAYNQRTFYSFDVLRVLIRAGAWLDFDIDGERITAEEQLRLLFDTYPDKHTELLDGIALATAVRAAGSWAEYAIESHRRVLALRSLRARGRAFATLSTPVGLERLLSPRFPIELAWRVLEYWRETN